jgi:hypothetical protein
MQNFIKATCEYICIWAFFCTERLDLNSLLKAHFWNFINGSEKIHRLLVMLMTISRLIYLMLTSGQGPNILYLLTFFFNDDFFVLFFRSSLGSL